MRCLCIKSPCGTHKTKGEQYLFSSAVVPSRGSTTIKFNGISEDMVGNKTSEAALNFIWSHQRLQTSLRSSINRSSTFPYLNELILSQIVRNVKLFQTECSSWTLKSCIWIRWRGKSRKPCWWRVLITIGNGYSLICHANLCCLKLAVAWRGYEKYRYKSTPWAFTTHLSVVQFNSNDNMM